MHEITEAVKEMLPIQKDTMGEITFKTLGLDSLCNQVMC